MRDTPGGCTLPSGFRAGLIEALDSPGLPCRTPDLSGPEAAVRENATMTAAAFDTHAAVKTLRDAGADEAMAEAIVNTASAAAGADRAALATKADLAEVRADLAGLESRMYRALWIQAAALIGTQLAIAGFIVHLLSQP